MKGFRIKIHWSFFILGILMIIFGKFSTFLCSIVCVVLHEMGHSVVGRKLGYNLDVITLLPYGAMLSGTNSTFSSDDEIKIAVAGPLVNVFFIVLSLIAMRFVPSDNVIYSTIHLFYVCNIYTFVFNVIPVYPLDGGRVFFALLTKKKMRAKAYKIVKIVGYCITSVFFVIFLLTSFYKLNYMIGINALFMLIGLVDSDNGAYYEKLTTLEKFRPLSKFGKVIKLDKSTTLFEVYK